MMHGRKNIKIQVLFQSDENIGNLREGTEVRSIVSRRNKFTFQVFVVQQPIFLYCWQQHVSQQYTEKGLSGFPLQQWLRKLGAIVTSTLPPVISSNTATYLNLEVRWPGREAEHPHSFHIAPSLRMSGTDFHFCARPFRTSSYNKSRRRLSRHVLLKIYIDLSFKQFVWNRLLYPWGRRWYPVDRTSCVCVCVCVGGGCPRARLGHCGEEKNLSPPGIEPPFPDWPVNSLYLKVLI